MDSCRWAPLLGSAPDAVGKSLVALPENEQVTRGRELLGMLRASADGSPETVPKTPSGGKAAKEDWNVVVKQTFIEVVIPQQIGARRRSLTDSDLPRGRPEGEQPWKSVTGKLQDVSDASTDASLDEEEPDSPVSQNSAAEDVSASSGDERDRGLPAAPPALHQCVDEKLKLCAPLQLQLQHMDFVPNTNAFWHAAREPPARLDASYMPTQWSNPSMGAVDRGSPAAGTTTQEWRTTVMIRNLPNNYTQDMLIALVDSMGFVGTYDFVYLPVDFKTQAGLGYAFINFVSVPEAQRCFDHFEGFRTWSVPSDKACAVTWSSPTQGFEEHVERYRNSPVMHPSLPDDWKPVLFQQGVRVRFPPPTKPIKTPKFRQHPSLRVA